MEVKLIRGTDRPEELVCLAARNDYLPDGIIHKSIEDVIADIEPSDDHVGKLDIRGTKAWLRTRQQTLIDHLMTQGHWGPFEHPQATIAIEGVSRVVTHQIVRHRHFTYDQQSLRYVEVESSGSFQLPEFRGEDFDVDRDGVHEIDDPVLVRSKFQSAYNKASDRYWELLDMGVPREQARKVLPMGVKSNIVMSGSARAWMHVLNVRTKANVQSETRRCAEAIFDELKMWMSYTFEKYDRDVLPLKLNP